MRHLIAVLVMVVVGLVFGSTAPSTTVLPVVDWSLDTTISSGNAFDSIKTTADTVTFFTKTARLEKGYEYILVINYSGTVQLSTYPGYLEALLYDANSTALYTIDHFDSLVSTGDCEVVALPVGTKIFGTKWTLRAHCHGDAGTVSFNKIQLFKRRAINVNVNKGSW